jgi:hypothetical protein
MSQNQPDSKKERLASLGVQKNEANAEHDQQRQLTKDELDVIRLQAEILKIQAKAAKEEADREMKLLDLQTRFDADASRKEIEDANSMVRKAEQAEQQISNADEFRERDDYLKEAASKSDIALSKLSDQISGSIAHSANITSKRAQNAASNLAQYRDGVKPAIELHESDLEVVAAQRTSRSVDQTTAKLALKTQMLQDRANLADINGTYAENRRKERQASQTLLDTERALARQEKQDYNDERKNFYRLESTFVSSEGVEIIPMRETAYTNHSIRIKSEHRPGDSKGKHIMPGVKGNYFEASDLNINKMKNKTKLLNNLRNEIIVIQRNIGIGANDTSILGDPDKFPNSVYSTALNILKLENQMTKKEIIADLMMGSESSFQTLIQSFITNNSAGLPSEKIQEFIDSFDTEFDEGKSEFINNFATIITDDLNSTKGIGNFAKIIKDYTPSYVPQQMNSLSTFNYNQLTILPPIENIDTLNKKASNLNEKIEKFTAKNDTFFSTDNSRFMHPKIDLAIDILNQIYSIIEKSQLKTIMEYREANGSTFDANKDRIKEIAIDRFNLQNYHAAINAKGVSYDYKGGFSNAVVNVLGGPEDYRNIQEFRKVYSESDYDGKHDLAVALSKIDAATVDLYKEHSAAIKDVLAYCNV